jgi:hypothetical protein
MAAEPDVIHCIIESSQDFVISFLDSEGKPESLEDAEDVRFQLEAEGGTVSFSAEIDGDRVIVHPSWNWDVKPGRYIADVAVLVNEVWYWSEKFFIDFAAPITEIST